MSDDFDDDSFMVDDSFLAEIDNITATASNNAGKTAQRTASLPGFNNVKPTKAGSGRNHSVGPTNNGFVNVRKSFAKTDLFIQNGLQTSTNTANNAAAGPSRPPRAVPAHPPSDDFGEFDLPPEDLAMLDKVSAPVRSSGQTQTSTTRPASIPSSRLGMGRTLGKSSSGSDGFQTHLNFRRENQSTKGKRWDRTIFAESGRRVDAAKIKAKGKGRAYGNDNDEVMSEEEDWGEPLAPEPKSRLNPGERIKCIVKSL